MAFRVAYQLMRAYWRVTRPTTHGALVAIWHKGELLLVRNSYDRYYCILGGYLQAMETPARAAAHRCTRLRVVRTPLPP
jgi:8-oxo-dGTP diphosphatase